MFNIRVFQLKNHCFYFCIERDLEKYSVCRTISELLEMPLEDYTDKLVKEVIIHSNYKIETYTFGGEISFDITFDLYDTPRETYVERFKNVFATQLTTLALGGMWYARNRHLSIW